MRSEKLISLEQKEELERELNFLVNEKKPAIIKQIQEARAQGDLSENADYDAAKNEQGVIEKRISEIRNTLNTSKLITNENKIEGQVSIGDKVQYINVETNEEHWFKIVGSEETDPINNKISYESPVAVALLNNKKGDIVEVKSIEKPYKIKITKIF